MGARSSARWSWLVALLCARAAAAQSPEPPASASQRDHGSEAAPALPTVRLLAGGATEPLTYSIEVDASFRALPGIPPPDRLSTAYRGYFAPLCVAPCAVHLPVGNYSLGLAKGGGDWIPVAAPLIVSHDTTVVGHYQSKRWRRNLGIAALVTGALVGAFLFTGAAAVGGRCPEDGGCPDVSKFVGIGAAALAVGTVAGIFLIASGRDSATIVQR